MAPGFDTPSSRRESSRLSEHRRVLDTATRQRRIDKQLEALEKDNFQDTPFQTTQQSPAKKRPRFGIEEELKSSTPQSSGKKKRRTRGDDFKQRFRKTFTALLEEERLRLSKLEPGTPDYFSASVLPSKTPARHFCAVCGVFSKYSCVSCGARYCSINCYGTHKDTRCLKWTV